MIRHPRSASSLPPSLAAALLTIVSACATTAGQTELAVGQQASLEGDVVRVDTSPWAYDGNAVITVATAASGTISVQLPARWNLCKAQPPGDVRALKPNDHVQVAGTVTAPGELVVCEQPQHRLQKVE